MIELRSDTFTVPTAAMRRAMAEARVGDDVYGEDPTVNHLEEYAAALLGKQAGCLLPSGTMANLASILAWAPRGGRLLVGARTDVYCYEAGGYSALGGVVCTPIPNRSDGGLDPADLRAEFDDTDDSQIAPVALICLENTQCQCGGTVLSPEHDQAVRALADARGVPIHLDGARIFNAAVAAGRPVADVAAVGDTVQFCLSKGLGAPIGSMVVSTTEAVARVRRIRKMLGGGMRQAGVIAAAGLLALTEMVDRLAEDHTNAARLAAGLAGLPGLRVQVPQTNIVMFDVLDERLTQAAFVAAAHARGVAVMELGGRVRAVTHAGVDAEQIDRAVEAFAAVLAKTPVAVVG
ncbi:threonine aldolase [Catenulispora sp. MAP5-51]|uniref:GntG family PLP-dependent aldolase n=1 Tax=Catenulispora sp. MAP5-51 TaxID=3156298 RepID=UPI0035181793